MCILLHIYIYNNYIHLYSSSILYNSIHEEGMFIHVYSCVCLFRYLLLLLLLVVVVVALVVLLVVLVLLTLLVSSVHVDY